MAEAGEEDVSGLAGETKIGNVFCAGLGGGEIWVVFFDTIPVKGEGGLVGCKVEANTKGGIGAVEGSADAVGHVVFAIKRLFVAEDEVAGDGGEDFVADFRGDFFGVVGSFWVVIGVVSWLIWGGWGLAGKLVF